MDLHLSSSSTNNDHQKVVSNPIPISFSSTTYAAAATTRDVLQLQHGHEGQQQQQHHINPPPSPPTAALPLSSKPPSSSFNANINSPISCPYPTTTELMKEKDQTEEEDHIIIPSPPPYKNKLNSNVVVMRYKECLKNHAAAMGGNATDGCGEFMPGGLEGTLEALRCSACNCHRNFHRKEIVLDHQGSSSSNTHHDSSFPSSLLVLAAGRNNLFLGLGTNNGAHQQQQHHKKQHSRKSAQQHLPLPPPPPPPQHIRMSSNNKIYNSADIPQKEMELEMKIVNKKKRRFRTKFTQEQKEKMLSFAEKAGWQIQKQEDSVVQQICQELGIKRRVLKVWMHNNKHNYLTVNNNNNIINSPSTTT